MTSSEGKAIEAGRSRASLDEIGETLDKSEDVSERAFSRLRRRFGEHKKILPVLLRYSERRGREVRREGGLSREKCVKVPPYVL